MGWGVPPSALLVCRTTTMTRNYCTRDERVMTRTFKCFVCLFNKGVDDNNSKILLGGGLICRYSVCRLKSGCGSTVHFLFASMAQKLEKNKKRKQILSTTGHPDGEHKSCAVLCCCCSPAETSCNLAVGIMWARGISRWAIFYCFLFHHYYLHQNEYIYCSQCCRYL